jgi:hypothetical protein
MTQHHQRNIQDKVNKYIHIQQRITKERREKKDCMTTGERKEQ